LPPCRWYKRIAVFDEWPVQHHSDHTYKEHYRHFKLYCLMTEAKAWAACSGKFTRQRSGWEPGICWLQIWRWETYAGI